MARKLRTRCAQIVAQKVRWYTKKDVLHAHHAEVQNVVEASHFSSDVKVGPFGLAFLFVKKLCTLVQNELKRGYIAYVTITHHRRIK